MGTVLTQKDEKGEEHVVTYGSRTLNARERKYSDTEKGCLAVLWSAEKFRPYMKGTHFIVITDHHSLTWLRDLKDSAGRLAKWDIRKMQHYFDINHRKVAIHKVPDAVSRIVNVEVNLTPSLPTVSIWTQLK